MHKTQESTVLMTTVLLQRTGIRTSQMKRCVGKGLRGPECRASLPSPSEIRAHCLYTSACSPIRKFYSARCLELLLGFPYIGMIDWLGYWACDLISICLPYLDVGLAQSPNPLITCLTGDQHHPGSLHLLP